MTDFVRGEVEGSNLYSHKKYKFNKKILDMIERETGKKSDLMNHQIEQVLQKVYGGEYTSLIKELTDTDKKKIMVNMKDASPTTAISYRDDEESYKKKFESISKFLKDNFTQEEVDEYIEHCLNEFYKPDELHNGTQYYNTDILNFLDTIGVEMVMGFVIIKDYMNHAINIFDDVTEDTPHVKETLMSEESLDLKFDKIRQYANDTEFIMTYENNDIFVIATDDLNTFEDIKSKINLKDDLIPRDYFRWGKDERNNELSLRERLNQAVQKVKETTNNTKFNIKDFVKNFGSLSDEEKSEALSSLTPEQVSELNNADETTFDDIVENKSKSGIDKLKEIMDKNSDSDSDIEIVSTSINIPPEAPFKVLYESKNENNILLHGYSYFPANFRIMDDYSDVTLLVNDSMINNKFLHMSSFDTIGGFTVGELRKYKDIDETIQNSGESIEETQGHVNSLVIKDFVGTIEMFVKVEAEDDNTYYIDPINLKDECIYYDEYIMEKYGEESESYVIVNINGTYSDITMLTTDIYNKL